MNQAKLEALLGRPLTSVEVTNLDLYLQISLESLKTLICSDLCDCGSATRVFGVREGYKTAFIDIFTELYEVKIDGSIVDSSEYSIRQWDSRSGSWYNSIVFKDAFTDAEAEIEVKASWGFGSEYPVDLQVILAGLFDLITRKNKLNPTVASKQTEDFRISFNVNADLDDSFYTKYSNTIEKYSICSMGYMRNGEGC